MAPAPSEKKNKRHVGAGLSLDKFATLGVSKFDKRKKIEQIKKQKLIKHSKYKKLKNKLEAQGVLSSAPVKDSVAELEALDADGSAAGSDHTDQGADHPANQAERRTSHAQAGPSITARPGARPPGAITAGGVSLTSEPRMRAQMAASAAPWGSTVRTGQSLDDTEEGRHKNQHDGTGPRREQEAAAAPETFNLGKPLGRSQRAGSSADGAKKRRKESDGGDEQPPDAEDRERSVMPSARTKRGRPSSMDDHGSKKFSRLQRLAQQVAEEKAEKQRAREVAMKEREERMKKVAAVEKGRKEQKHLHFKRNAKGQPLMRYRMEKLLTQLQKAGQ